MPSTSGKICGETWSERAGCKVFGCRRRPLRQTGGAVLAEQRVEQFLEGAPAAQDSRFHRADAAFEHFGDFLVAQPFEITQDDRAAKHIGNLTQRLLYHVLNLARRQLVKRRPVQVLNLDRRLAFVRLRVDGNVLLQVTLEPAAVVEGFANGDPVQPGFQGTSLTKLADALEGFQKRVG